MSHKAIVSSELIDTAEHHAQIRAGVAKLVGGFGRKYFQDVVRRDAKPTELWNALGAAGYLGVQVPEAYGGGGAGLAELNVIIEEVAAQGCPLLAMVINSICVPILVKHGSAKLRQEWLPGLGAGTKRMSFAITEPDAGTNTHRITTTARKTERGWSISGTKYYTSAVDEAHAILVVARVFKAGEEAGASARQPLSLFVVPADAKGITAHPIDCALHATEKQFTVFFDDVTIPHDAIIGDEGAGLRQVFAGLNPERVSAAAVNNGIARFAIDKAAQYASDRKVWSTPIGAHQGLAHPLAKAYVNVQLARMMTAKAAAVYDAGGDAGEAANMAKFAAADASLEALDQAIQTHGGNGLSNEYGLADLWFIARLHKTAPVSREMILNYISQHSLGLPKSY